MWASAMPADAVAPQPQPSTLPSAPSADSENIMVLETGDDVPERDVGLQSAQPVLAML